MKTKTVVQYSYIKPINKKWLAKKGLELNQPVSAIVDQIISSIRTGNKLDLVKVESSASKRIKKSVAKKKARIKAIGKKKVAAKKGGKGRKGGKGTKGGYKRKAPSASTTLMA